MTDLPSWLVAKWRQLQERQSADRFPHALLLYGPKGLGKNLFADRLGRSLLCQQPDDYGLPCGGCHACQMCDAETHPDLRWVQPEEQGKAIRIDTVRELCTHLTLKAQFGAYKVAIVSPADRMNIAASNALLKTLEEPPADTLLILVTARPAYLPATIRSRCQALAFVPPDRQKAVQWLRERGVENADSLLAIAHDAPFLAEKLSASDCIAQRRQLLHTVSDIRAGSTDLVATAANYAKQEGNSVCSWMLSYVTDMIRLKLVADPPRLSNEECRAVLEQLAGSFTHAELFALQDALVVALRLLETPINAQLLLEDLFMYWKTDAKKAVGER